MGVFKSIRSKISKGLSRTRESFASGLRTLITGRTLDEDLLRDLERALIQADVGVQASRALIGSLRDAWKSGQITQSDEVLGHLKEALKQMWPQAQRQMAQAPSGPTVILVAGVNGAGKTTSVAKIAHTYRSQNKRVLLAACDTFRAGAVRQLEIWSERLGVEIIRGQQGGDPAAVAFDACEAALSRQADVLLIDTAGRLQTQDPLMRQLTKIRDVVARKIPGAPHEVILVLDATSGQNALRQAEAFTNAIDVTGLFLAKLDGTAKGGAVVGIRQETEIPVKLVGIGETPEDVQAFDPGQFLDALFDAEAVGSGA
ncbi:MAG: signal recognition particle-docking protein FtsY [Planctomycetota bacterium]|jgi:fused signal recognition particle receptor